MTSSAIRSVGLTKRYGAHRGIEGLDLDVRVGEVYGFLGPNGAGKSTTIHLLVGLIRPTDGRTSVLGHDGWIDRDRLARRVGFLPGEFTLHPRLTGEQMLTYLARLRRGVPSATRDALVERFEVELHRPIRDLSMGNRQKLGLVQAFMHEPELLILDEPTLGLDPLIQREFQSLLGEVRGEGRTVFLSSHRLSEVQRVADRVGIIRDGALVEVAEVNSLTQIAVRRIDLEFAVRPEVARFEGLEGVRHVAVDGNRLVVEVEGSVAQLMKVAADHDIVDVHIHESDLEDLFLAHYRSPGSTT